MPIVPPAVRTAESLVPHLRNCGYTDALIQQPFMVDHVTVPVVAFSGKPFDCWSACIAGVNLGSDSRASAAEVRALGASTVFVRGPQGVDRRAMGAGGPTTRQPILWPEVGAVFRRHENELAPSRIYNAKLRRPGSEASQLWFFDAGLMPAVEKNRGQTLLRLVENAIRGLHSALGSRLDTRQAQEDVYRTVFWLLAAKVLHDKSVPNFVRIDLCNVDEVFERIGRHHGETEHLPPFGKAGRRAIDAVAEDLARCGSLADVSSESIAYVYENALIDKAAGWKKAKQGQKAYDIRKELGIHSTPSVLIHHMLAQMWGMIEEIDPDDRYVFEPACGHAPFLTAAMRWLRDWSQESNAEDRHGYLRSHLHGLEADDFALELAKLVLTLADEPHGNTWQLTRGDMFLPGVLARHAQKAHILLSNPPYEAFTPTERAGYAKQDEPVTAHTKATEMLLRTLPHLPPGGVFGVVMPQGVLHDKESKPVRERLLADFDLSEISVFADNLFEHSDHEVAVLIGRRRKPRAKPVVLHYRRVREHGMEAFKERLAFSSEQEVLQRRFTGITDADLRVPDLDEVWRYLSSAPRLKESTYVQQGRQYWEADKLESLGLLSRKPKLGFIAAVLRAEEDYTSWRLPKRVWINPSRSAYRTQGGGAAPGTPQVLVNYAPIDRGAWRLKAVMDDIGIGVASRFVVFRPKSGGPSRAVLWAILNSPISNAFAFCHSGKRQTLVGEWRQLPLPAMTNEASRAIESAASAYLAIAKASESAFMQPDIKHRVQQALLALDAAVLRAYDLPPRLERQLLDLFTGVERKGVGCDFRGYYPPGFTSCLPLHMIISDRFQRAKADVTADRFKPGESEYVRDVLAAAAAGGREE